MQITLCDFLGRDNFRFSPYVWRTKLALAHKKLDYEVVGTTFLDKSALEGWTDYRLAPVLKHGDSVVCDSWDIANYLERVWPSEGLLFPDHKTIADFRKDHGKAIRKVCSKFVELCRRIGLLAEASIAIDGSKFKAVNNRDRNFTKAKMARRMKQIEESVERYLHQLDSADRQEPTEAIRSRVVRLHEKIDKLHAEMQRLQALEEQMMASPDEQVSLTDPDARSMATSGRGSGVVGYNVQAAVDTTHHLIVAHDVIQSGSDRASLTPMAERAKQALRVDKIDVVADRGYFSSEQIKACADAGVTPTLPKPVTTGMKAKGMFGSIE